MPHGSIPVANMECFPQAGYPLSFLPQAASTFGGPAAPAKEASGTWGGAAAPGRATTLGPAPPAKGQQGTTLGPASPAKGQQDLDLLYGLTTHDLNVLMEEQGFS